MYQIPTYISVFLYDVLNMYYLHIFVGFCGNKAFEYIEDNNIISNLIVTVSIFYRNMHHMYPVSKGDQLCPLGFHPQVRWPTRCKRCFRDYKEHGGKRGDDVAASSPSLSEATNSR